MIAILSETAPIGVTAEPKSAERHSLWWVSLFAALAIAFIGLFGLPSTAAAGSITGAKVTLGTTVAGTTTTATITFVPQSAIPSGGRITVTFPATYVVNSTTVTHTGFTSGTTVAVVSTTQSTVTLATSLAGTNTYTPTAGQTLTVTLNNITLPAAITGTTTDVANAIITTDSSLATLDTISGALTFPALTAGQITNGRVSLGTTVAGSTTTATMSFVPQSAIPSGGRIQVTFPTGSSAYTVAPTLVTHTGFTAETTLSITSINQTTVTLTATTNGGSNVSVGGAALSVSLNGVTLPPNATAGTVGVLEALATIDATQKVLNTISGSLSFPQLIAGALTNTSVTLSSNAKGTTGDVTLAFTIANPIPAGGSIIVTLPSGYTGSGATGIQAIAPASLCAPSCTASLTGQTITVVIGSNTIAKGTGVSLKLTNITNPPTATAGAAFTIRTTTAASTGVPAYDVDTGQVTGPTITNSSLSSAQASLSATQAGATATATFTFTTDDAWPSDGKVMVTFPAGFCAGTTATVTVKIGTGTAAISPTVTASPQTCSSNGVTYMIDRPGGGVIVAGGTAIMVTITGVVNPTTTGPIAFANGAIKTIAADGTTVIATSTTVTSVQPSITGGLLTGGSVTAQPNTSGATASVAVPFLITNPIPTGGSIQIAFPGDSASVTGIGAYVLTSSPWLASLTNIAYYLPASGTVCTSTLPSGAIAIAGATGATGTPTSTVPYLITLPQATGIPAGACVIVTVGAVRLPQIAGRSANFTITTRAPGVGSATGTLIDTGLANGAATVSPGILANASFALASQASAPDNDTGKPVKVTVSFTTSATSPLPVGGRVTITFPTSPAPFAFGSVAIDSITLAVSGGATSTVSGLFTVSNLYVAPDLDLNYAGSSPLPSGATVTITLTGLTNPVTSSVTSAQSSGTPTQWTVTTRAPATLGSLPMDQIGASGPIIVPALAGGPGATPLGAATGLGSPTVDFATGQAGTIEPATIRLKLVNPLPVGSAIRITFPLDGFDASGATVQGGAAVVTSSTGATSTGAFAVSTATARTIGVTYTGLASFNDSATLPAGATIALPITGVRLPSTVPATGSSLWGTTGTSGTTGVVTIQTESSAGYLIDRAPTSAGVHITPARAANVTFGVSPTVTNATASFAVNFTVGTEARVPACLGPVFSLSSNSGAVSGRTGTCGTVTITLPPSVTMPDTIAAGNVTVSVNGGVSQAVAAVVKAGTAVKLASPFDLPAGSLIRIEIGSAAGIRTPATGGTYTALVRTSSSPDDAESAGVTIGAPASGVTVQPVSPTLIGSTSGGLVITFTNGAGAALSANAGTITIGFPPSFPIPTTIARQFVLINGTPIASGSSPSITPRPGGGQLLTFPVPVTIAAGAPVDVAIWAAANIAVPTNAGPHTISVQTSAAPVDVTGTVSFTPEPANRLLVIFPGELAAPGSAPGKTGAPSLSSGQAGTIILRAVDRFYNKAPSTATIALAYTDTLTTLPTNVGGQNRVTLVGGESTFVMTPARPGAYTFTATDSATVNPLAPVNQSLAVTAGTFSNLLMLLTGEALAPSTPTGIANTSGPIAAPTVPATVQVTVVATDAAFNQTTTSGYQVTVTGGVSPVTATLTNGTAQVTVSLPVGATTLTVTGAGPKTGSRVVTVSSSATSIGGGGSSGSGGSSGNGGSSGGSSSGTAVSTAPKAPSTTPPPITPVSPSASPTPPASATLPTDTSPNGDQAPVATPAQLAPIGATIAPESSATEIPAVLPSAQTDPTPAGTTESNRDPNLSPSPTPLRLSLARNQNLRAVDLPPFVPESEVVAAAGARIGFAPGTQAKLSPGTTPDAVALLPAVAFALPGVGTPPPSTQPLAVFQSVARDNDGGSTPFTARHLITLNPTGLLGTAPSGVPYQPSNVMAFEDRDGRWVPISTRLDEATGNLTADATRGLVMFLAFDPAAIRPEADYTIGQNANGEPRVRFYTQTNGREPGAIPLGFAISDTADGPSLRTEFDRIGGIDRVGYPVSAETTFKGFQVQVMQRAILQWVGDPSGTGGRAAQMNILDELTSSGFDEYLHATLRVPKTFDNAADEGLSMDEVIVRHIGFLDDNALTRAAYMANPDHFEDYGLPTAFEEFEDAYVVRTQRAVIQLWKVSGPLAKAGDITIVGAGELLKDMALIATSLGDTPPIPLDAFTPEIPPSQ